MCFGRTDDTTFARCQKLDDARRIAVVLAALIAAAASLSHAVRAQATADEQRPPATAQGTLSTDQLTKRLELLRGEFDREHAAAAQAKQRHDEEAAKLAERRKQLADRLLGAELARQRDEVRLQSLRQDGADADANLKALAGQANSLAAALRDAAEQLRLHLREVPGSDETIERLAHLATKTPWTPGSGDATDHAPAIDELLAICDSAHEHATRVGVTDAQIFTAAGHRERVELLAVGHVRFAYVTANGDRVGVSLSSPAEASGYRWTEHVDAQTQQLVRDAVKRCRSNDSDADIDSHASGTVTGIVAVPLDPTGRLTVDDAAGESSVYAWFTAGGLVMIPLACVAVAALALIVERTVFFFGRNPSADKLAEGTLDACRAGSFQEAQRICTQRGGCVPRVLAACLARRPQGQRAMEDAIQTQLLHELPPLQRFMGALSTLAGVAPLLGLLGTVTGIIQTFSVIRSFGNTNPSLMAGGISEALVTTALGLLIAVPVIIVHSLLRSRSDRIVADAERHSATLLTTLAHYRSSESPSSESPSPTPEQRSASSQSQSQSQSLRRTTSRAAKPQQPPIVAAESQPAKELTVDR